MFKSSDGGASWRSINRGLPSSFIQALAIDPKTTSTLYIGAGGYGLFKSLNGGEAWSHTGLEGYINAIAIDPDDPLNIYVTGEKGVVKSMDGGETWNRIFSCGRQIAWVPTSPPALYLTACYEAKLFKSMDGGQSWQEFPLQLPDSMITTLTFDPKEPTTLYVGTNNRGVFRSADGGDTWEPFNEGLFVKKVNVLAAESASGASIFAGVDAGSVFVYTFAHLSQRTYLPVLLR